MRSLLLVAMVVPLLAACKGDGDEETTAFPTTGSTSSGSDTEGTDTTAGTAGSTGVDPTESVAIDVQREVDILLVIDNSGSMGEEQAKLSASIGALTGALESTPNVDYRIGVTTTDTGNPRCTPDLFKAPASGDLQLSSCRDRLGGGGDKSDFIFDVGSEVVDATPACTDACTEAIHDALAGGPVATPIEDSSDGERPRKWIERIGGGTNLPAKVASLVAGYPENNDADPQNDVSPLAAAFACYGPQGINGCGFETPLQGMYLALTKAESQSSADNYGFLRDASTLAVVVVTDELDCSFNDTEIFVSNQTFWEPGSTGATSAVCWNAGVLCEGAAPGPYTDCRVADFDTSGQLLDPGDPSTDEDAALIPVKRFIDTLQGIENTKKSINQDHEVLVSVIGGVPPGYASGDAEILYLDSSNLDEQILFGIGPGCTTADGGVGLPPVRLREFAESFAVGADRNLHSICGSDYTAALTSLADRIRDQLGASCLPVCAGDTDPQTPVLDPYCLVEQEVGGDLIAIPECVADPNSGYSLPDAAELCFYYLRDSDNLTPTPDDDLSPKCADEGWNLEFGFVRAGGTPMPSQVRASCELSELPSVDCPDLY